jgi:hypothetical protein
MTGPGWRSVENVSLALILRLREHGVAELCRNTLCAVSPWERAMNAVRDSAAELTPLEWRELRRLVGLMVPANAEYGVPGADDEVIFADIVRSLGRDRNDVRAALTMLRDIASGEFTGLDEAKAEDTAMAFLVRQGPVITALGRAVLQCYYRDDRVICALGIEPVAPYPKGRVLEQGDWSLLDAVRGRPRLWRDVDGAGA